MAYNIIVSPKAFYDLDEVSDYIGKTLCAPDAARNLISRIVEEIGTLADFPFRGAKVEFDFNPALAVRRLVVGEFLIFYRMEEVEKTVYVLRVRYGRTDYFSYLKYDDDFREGCKAGAEEANADDTN